MTASELVTAARDLYNGVGDTFFSDTQIYNWLTHASDDMARKAWLIEGVSTGNTVASTQTISYPTNAIAIKRVVVNGSKISPITFRQDDAITLSNQNVTTTGRPAYYVDYNSTLYLRPIPDDVYAYSIYAYYTQAQISSATTTPDIPSQFHMDLVDYVLFRMYTKDKDPGMAKLQWDLWQDHLQGAISFTARKKRRDSFATVQDESTLPVNILGAV